MLVIIVRMNISYDSKEFYRAHLARDVRFDGKFFIAVRTTMIYCRPTCPARKAKLKNLSFYIHAAQAEEAGYRPCLRCRPETAPGSAAWIGTSATVQRAVRMMDTFALDGLSIKEIAEKLGIGERWLRELFQQQVGASPQAILISRKLDIARNLLDNSSLSITEIAFSSGFQSIRRFNDAFKSRFKQAPRAIRKKKKPCSEHGLDLQLSYRPPFAWHNLLDFFKQRVIPTMEFVDEKSYQRLFTCGDVRGYFKATLAENNKVKVSFKLNKAANIIEYVARIKNMFDLDADPMAIEKNLSEDEILKVFFKKQRGLRIPGCWDGFELAVRAIIGQKISVKSARTVLIRLVEKCGEKQNFDESISLQYFFPTPKNILKADISNIGLTIAKEKSLKCLAEAVRARKIILDGTAPFEQTCEQLLAIKGIGPWTVEYVAMRALKKPDAFPETDLEIKKKLKQFKLDPQKWMPWRAYAAVLLLNL